MSATTSAAPNLNGTTTHAPHINGISHAHVNGTASVPASAPATPAALADSTLDAPVTRPGTPAASGAAAAAEPVADEEVDPLYPARPDTPTTFAAALQELSHDLVLKEQQIEWLVRNLPGAERGQEEQEARIRELNGELRGLEKESAEAEEQRRRLLERVERAIMRISRW